MGRGIKESARSADTRGTGVSLLLLHMSAHVSAVSGGDQSSAANGADEGIGGDWLDIADEHLAGCTRAGQVIGEGSILEGRAGGRGRWSGCARMGRNAKGFGGGRYGDR